MDETPKGLHCSGVEGDESRILFAFFQSFSWDDTVQEMRFSVGDFFSECEKYILNLSAPPVWIFSGIAHYEGTLGKGTSYKKLQDTATSSFIYYCFTSAFTSVDIIFQNFLDFHSLLSEKRFVTQVFLF